MITLQEASNGNIWNEPARNVARRLRLPTESETPFTSSYRLYTWGKNYSVRWIHVDEAEAVNNKGGYVIDI